MGFAELVAAAILLLAPDMAAEARILHILPTDSHHPGYVMLDQPTYVWVNPDLASSPLAMHNVLAHELTHLRDFHSGLLTNKTCGEEFAQAEFRAHSAEQRLYGPGLLNWIRLQNWRPC